MKRMWNYLYGPILVTSLLLSGCSAQHEEHRVDAANLHDKTLNTKGNGHVHGSTDNPNVIPSVDRGKKRTTNANGQTTNGLGTNVYSLIGSSSLHDGGISSHLESRLSGAGIPGIKVFVLDDTVILARAGAQTTSTQYDEMQQKVLTNTSGSSGKGNLDGIDMSKLNTDDNLDKAKGLMSKAFDGQVQILTITNPKAMPLIDGIKANIKASKTNYTTLASDINTLIKMAREK